MGWSNYIVIHDLKIAIEISRYIDDLEEYEKEALDYLIEEKDLIDLDESKVVNLTLRTLSFLTISYDKVSSLNGLDSDRLLLYWLESRKIEYDILSEYCVDIDKLKEDGYVIISKYDEGNNAL